MMTTLRNRLFATLFAILVLSPFTAGLVLAVEIERVKSSGGIEAWLVRDHTNPIISMRFSFRGGAGLEYSPQADRSRVEYDDAPADV